MAELQVHCGTGFQDILIGKGLTFNPQIIRKINRPLWNDLLYLFKKPPWALIKFLDRASGHLLEAGGLLNFPYFQQV